MRPFLNKGSVISMNCEINFGLFAPYVALCVTPVHVSMVISFSIFQYLNVFILFAILINSEMSFNVELLISLGCFCNFVGSFINFFQIRR